MKSTTYSTVPLGTIQLAAYNPRRMPESEMQALVRSLEAYGFVQPVIIRDGDNVCIGGHQRLAAYTRLLTRQGLDAATIAATPVPVAIVSGLNESETRALNVALNRIGGEWDFSALASVVASLDPANIDLTGLTDIEVKDLDGIAKGIPDITSRGAEVGDVQRLLDIEGRKLKLQFSFATDDELRTVLTVLQAHGLKTKADAGRALLAVCQKAVAP